MRAYIYRAGFKYVEAPTIFSKAIIKMKENTYILISKKYALF